MSNLSKNRIARFPCGDCRSNCVLCSKCNTWYHGKCQFISDDELNTWGNIDLGYICVPCRTMDGNEFDYLMGMHRLLKAACSNDITKLKEVVERELLFKTVLEIQDEPSNPFPDVDSVAADVMDTFVDAINGNPRKTSGDGDCLFNTVSILVSGTENLTVKLRYHTCLELTNNQELYMLHPLRSRIQCLSSSYEKNGGH